MSLPVVVTASKGLAVQLGDEVAPLTHLAVEAHKPRITSGDWVRERGSGVLDGDRFGKVVTFYDCAGNEHSDGATYALCVMNRRSDFEPGAAGPKIYRVQDIERVPFGDWPKGAR